MGKIEEYKQALGYGVRENLFKVEFIIPAIVESLITTSKGSVAVNNIDTIIKNIKSNILTPKSWGAGTVDASKKLELMIHSVNMPGPRKTVSTKVPFRGQHFNVPMERSDFEDITIRFRPSEDMILYNAFDVWCNLIKQPLQDSYRGNVGYIDLLKTNTFNIHLLDKDFKTIRKVECKGVYPEIMSGFDLAMDKGTIPEVNVTFAIDSYTVRGSSGNLLDEALTAIFK